MGTDIVESGNAVKLASNNYNIYSTIGVHPADIRNAIFDEREFQELVDEYNNLEKYNKKNIVAIGECGLDYYQLKKYFSSPEEIKNEKDRQDKLFRQQILFAIKNNLPLMLHGRADVGDDAYIDMLNILSEYKDQFKLPIVGNAHFFVGSIDIAKRFLKLRFTFSIGGVLTITNDYDELYKYIPLDKINIETDSPYV
ncbi:MAG: TatD family hydrolase, partial [Cyanobium sp. MAG06]|nr:TatD family hydrolase [Cyanobium sp. MAG06]